MERLKIIDIKKSILTALTFAMAVLPWNGVSGAAAIPAAHEQVNRILSLDLCTDWMLAKYAQPSQVLAMSSLIHEYPVEWGMSGIPFQ